MHPIHLCCLGFLASFSPVWPDPPFQCHSHFSPDVPCIHKHVLMQCSPPTSANIVHLVQRKLPRLLSWPPIMRSIAPPSGHGVSYLSYAKHPTRPFPTSSFSLLAPHGAAQLSHGLPTRRAVQSQAASSTATAPATLAELIHPHCAPEEEVEEEFGGALRMLEVIIGGVPNCCFYSAIWPPGAYTYHLLPPNFLNLPQSLAGTSLNLVRSCAALHACSASS